jgi:DmsE family decaheme c-type cytochrome
MRVVAITGGALGVLAGAALLAVPAPAPAQRPAAVAAAAAQPATGSAAEGYIGAEACKGCHEDSYHRFAETRMGRLFLKQPRTAVERTACESCHGPGKAHADAGGGKGREAKLITFAKDDPTPIDQRNAVCLSCHTKGNRVFWQGSPHDSRDLGCTSCHRVMENHSPTAQLAKASVIETCGTCHLQRRAQTMRSSHMPLREGKMTCTSCHNPHGTVTPALLREQSANDTCYTCHTEKRGPFLWPHPPVQENCANCHDPHGSNHERMLKVSKPRLCQQCHVETRHPTRPYGQETVAGNFRFTLGRQCVTCHVNIHGSNHPSGFAYTR